MVEHPFGTIKNWGYASFSVTTLEKVRGEFSLMCLCYNLRRVISLLGVRRLLETLKNLQILTSKGRQVGAQAANRAICQLCWRFKWTKKANLAGFFNPIRISI